MITNCVNSKCTHVISVAMFGFNIFFTSKNTIDRNVQQNGQEIPMSLLKTEEQIAYRLDTILNGFLQGGNITAFNQKFSL